MSGMDSVDNQKQSLTENNGQNDKGSRWKTFRPTVEPMVLLFMFTYVTTSSVGSGLMLERVCGTSDTSQCTNDQRAYSTTLLMYKSIIEAIVPAIVSLFLGTWSDKYGRRPLFLWSFFGNGVTYALYCGLSTIPDLKAEFLLLPSIVSTFSGGMMNLMAIANVYISDISSEEDKEFRLGILDSSQYLALMIGSGVSAPIFSATSYPGVYGVAVGCMVVSFLYTFFLLNESKPPLEHPESESCGCCGGVFRPQLMIDAMKTCFKKRPHHARPAIFMVIAGVVAAVLISQGEGTASYQYTNQKFGWSVQDVQWFGFYNNGMTALGTMLGVIIMVKVFHFSEITIALLTFTFKIVAAILFAVSPDWRYMYIGGAVASIGGMVWVLARTMLTRLVAKNELGQAYGMAVTFEAISPLVASPMYTGVYTATIDTFPGAFYLLSTGIYVVVAILLVTAAFITRGAKKEAKSGPGMKNVDSDTELNVG